MKSIARVAVGIVALTAFSLSAAPASADPAWCGRVITAPGARVTLMDNLYCDGTALTVAADDVTIDLAGFTIKGGASDPAALSGGDPRYGGHAVGVHVIGASRARITGGTILGFDAGVVADRATTLLVERVSITSPKYWGVWARDTNGLAVSGSTISGTWRVGEDVPMDDRGHYPEDGIEVADCRGIAIADSTVSGFRGNGILTERATGVTITGTRSVDNAGDGVQSWATGDAFTVRNSSVVRNEVGIQYDHSIGAATITIDTVTASENRQHGVWVTDLRRASVTKVDASGNGGVGIWLSSGIHSETGTLVSFQATISGSTATGNGQDGIGLDGTGAWWLTKNVATGNAAEGFVAVGGRVTSSGNASNKNSRNGFLWDIGTTGTSTADTAALNRANGVRVNAGSGRALALTDLTATGSGGHGLLAWSGTATVTRGSFSGNALDGIRVASGGTGYLSNASAVKNSGNGAAFLAGSTGYGYHLTASSNGRYGICTDPAAAYTNYPPHELLFNGAGATGRACDALLFPWWRP